MLEKPATCTIDDIDVWINRDRTSEYASLHCGVLGVDWAGSYGFGRWELILDEEGIPHIYTEHMDKNDSKEFSKKILQAILDKAIIEE